MRRAGVMSLGTRSNFVAMTLSYLFIFSRSWGSGEGECRAVGLLVSDCSQSIAGIATSIFNQMIPSRLPRRGSVMPCVMNEGDENNCGARLK